LRKTHVNKKEEVFTMKGHLRFRPEKGKASKRCSVPNQDKQYGQTESYKPERYGQVKHKQFQGGAHLVP